MEIYRSFFSLVPILEYGSHLWDPQVVYRLLTVETDQRKFLSFSAYYLKEPCSPHDYELICKMFKLSSKVDRR